MPSGAAAVLMPFAWSRNVGIDSGARNHSVFPRNAETLPDNGVTLSEPDEASRGATYADAFCTQADVPAEADVPGEAGDAVLLPPEDPHATTSGAMPIATRSDDRQCLHF